MEYRKGIRYRRYPVVGCKTETQYRSALVVGCKTETRYRRYPAVEYRTGILCWSVSGAEYRTETRYRRYPVVEYRTAIQYRSALVVECRMVIQYRSYPVVEYRKAIQYRSVLMVEYKTAIQYRSVLVVECKTANQFRDFSLSFSLSSTVIRYPYDCSEYWRANQYLNYRIRGNSMLSLPSHTSQPENPNLNHLRKPRSDWVSGRFVQDFESSIHSVEVALPFYRMNSAKSEALDWAIASVIHRDGVNSIGDSLEFADSTDSVAVAAYCQMKN